MKRVLIVLATLFVGATLVAADADAARLGGGRSSGIQRNYTSPPSSVPYRQATPVPRPQTPAAAPASGLSRWMPMLGGLALGGLLGSMFGGANGFGGVLMLALLALAAFFVVRLLLRSRQPAAPPMQFSGVGGQPPRLPLEPASAGAPSAPPFTPNIPAGFDVTGFLRAARTNFNKLQIANDSGDLEAIREVATPEMYEELSGDVRARGGQKQTTDVVSVDADLIELVKEGDTHYAGVRFSGLVREESGTPPQSFSEVWTLVKPADGSSGWLLAGIQQELSR